MRKRPTSPESHINEKHNNLTVLSILPLKNGEKLRKAICSCECGAINEFRLYSILSGQRKSCGCLAKESQKLRASKLNYKHGGTHERLYNIWCGMKSRCYLKSAISYHRYGGRGIKVCDEWLNNYVNFKNWALSNGYDDNLTLNRKDNDKNYCPENCNFVDLKTQQNNRSTNIRIEINNESHTVMEWCEIKNINPDMVYKRILRGWDRIDAILIPKKNHK